MADQVQGPGPTVHVRQAVPGAAQEIPEHVAVRFACRGQEDWDPRVGAEARPPCYSRRTAPEIAGIADMQKDRRNPVCHAGQNQIFRN
jgi:hypothetical protein